MKRSIKLFFYVLLTLCIQIIQAQNKQNSVISGVVCDSLTKKSLPFCTILVLKESDSTFVFGTITDKDGKYNLENVLSSPYIVKFNFVGYRSKKARISLPDNMIRDTVFLSMVPVSLGEVSITAQVFERYIDKLIMDASLIKLPVGSTVVDLVKEVPGAYISSENNLTIIGKDVRILIDDAPVRLPFDKLIHILNGQSSKDIGKIEIMYSPPPKYIDEWNGPMINIVTKKKLESGFYGTVTNFSSYGKYPRDEFSIDVNYRTSKINAYVLFDTRFSTREVIKKVTQTNLANNQISVFSSTKEKEKEYGSYLTSGFGVLLNEKSNIDITYNGNFFRYQTTLNDSISYFTPNFPDTTAFSLNQKGKHNTNHEFNVFYKKKISEDSHFITVEIDYALSDINTKQNRNFNFFNGDLDNSLYTEFNRDITKLRSKNFFTRIDHSIKVKKFKIESGLKYSFSNVPNDFIFENNTSDSWINDPTKSNYFVYKESIFSGYLSAGEQLSSKFGYSLSLRGSNTWSEGVSKPLINYYKNDYFRILPSIFMNYKVDDNNEITLNYDRTITRPFFGTLNPFISFDSPILFTMGNPSLIPEINNSINIMHRYKSVFISTLSYRMSINSISLKPILNSSGNEVAGYMYSNFGSSKAINLSSMYLKRFLNNKLSLSLIPSVSYTINDDTGSDFHKESFNYIASLISTYTIDKSSKWMLSIYNIFTSGMSINYSQYGSEYKCGLSMSRSFFHNYLNCSFDINDLFNSGDRRINLVVKNIEYKTINIPDSRFFRLRMSYSFSKKNLEQYDRHDIYNEEKSRIK